MPHTRRSNIEQLRTAIDCLPLSTRQAMLDGVRHNEIIVGAYTDRRGGVCPMLAAHRCGGRTSFISFARAWDRFAGAKRMRRATRRELLVLTSHLEASILAEAAPASELGRAIGDHQALARRRRAAEAARTGWSWLRPFRRRPEPEAPTADDRDREAELVET